MQINHGLEKFIELKKKKKVTKQILFVTCILKPQN